MHCRVGQLQDGVACKSNGASVCLLHLQIQTNLRGSGDAYPESKNMEYAADATACGGFVCCCAVLLFTYLPPCKKKGKKLKIIIKAASVFACSTCNGSCWR